MKTYLTFGLGIAALVMLPVLTVQGASGCPDGNTGNNTLVCDITPPQANNDDDQFDGDLGDDILTQAAGVSTVDIDGDGSKTHDYRGGGNGGHDTIYNYGTVTASIAGDWTAGSGGNDTIYNYGYVQNNIMGDEATGAGGNDTIYNYATVNGTINGEDGSDTVVILDGSSGGSDNRLLLEGGPGTDVLIFRFNTSASAAQVASQRQRHNCGQELHMDELRGIPQRVQWCGRDLHPCPDQSAVDRDTGTDQHPRAD